MAKVKSDGKGIQTWSQLPLETIGDYRELGFVHGSNRIDALQSTEFPHASAELAYSIGYDYGVARRNPQSREYAAAGHGYTYADADETQRREIIRRLPNGAETTAWTDGRDYAHHERSFPRTIREAVGQ